MGLAKLIVLEETSIRHPIVVGGVLGLVGEFWIAALCAWLGVNAFWLVELASRHLPGGGWVAWLVVGLLFLPLGGRMLGIAFGVWSAVFTDRIVPFACAQFMYGFGVAIGWCAAMLTFGWSAGTVPQDFFEDLMGALAMGVALGIMQTAVGVLVRIVVRGFLLRVAKRAEFQCAWCGYDVGSGGIRTCPECGVGLGKTPGTSRLLAASVRASHRAIPVGAALLLTVVCAWACARLTVGVHVRRFLDSYVTDYDSGWYVMGESAPSSFTTWSPFPGEGKRGVLITYAPWVRGDGPAMAFEVFERTGGNTFPTYAAGTPVLTGELSAREARQLLARVDLDTVLARFQSAADESGWTATGQTWSVIPWTSRPLNVGSQVDLTDLIEGAGP